MSTEFSRLDLVFVSNAVVQLVLVSLVLAVSNQLQRRH